MTDILVSSIVKNQIPDFIRGENPKFILFLEKYYEWLEQSNNAIGQTKNLDDSKDLDLVNEFYLNQIIKEFLPNFPQEILLDKSKFLKHIGEYYRAKGTPESVKFLFRILYNEEIDIYYPKEQIIKASDGKWVLPLALRVETGDLKIFDIEKTKITGIKSRATAVVEKVIKSIDRQLGIEYIELYISNVDKLFTTGENVTTTLVNTDGTEDLVTAKLIGSLSEIKIDPRNRGLFYNGFDTNIGYDGDPVTIIGGLNPLSGNPIGAIATVGEVLRGSVEDVFVINGGFGFRDPAIYPDSSIIDFRGGFEQGILGSEAKARILLLNERVNRTLNVSNITLESFFGSTINAIDNVSNNKTITALTTKQTLNVFPISYITVDSSGGGYRTKPDVDIYSLYMEELNDTLIIQTATAIQGTNLLRDETQDLRNSFEVGERVKLFLRNRYEDIKTVVNVSSNTVTFDSSFDNNINNLSVFKLNRRNISDVGSLGRITIINGGEGYSVGDQLIFSSNGRGYGANAEVSQIHSGNNGIRTIIFNETDDYVRGGEGYTMLDLPTITIDSPGGGSNAQLVVTEIVGEGTDLDLATSRIGAISTIRVVSFGYDYVEAPIISLRNADLTLSNVTEGQIFVANTKVYQGESNISTSWSAYVDKFIQANNFLRIYNYSGTFDRNLPLKSDDNEVYADIITASFYGDGRAKATANFENGLIRYPGIYLNTDGQPSSDQKLQDEKKYHNYSYVINTKNDYYKFKKTLKETTHPIGMKTFVTRIDDNFVDVANSEIEVIYLTQKFVSNTFNISLSTNNMVSTGDNSNVELEITVNDIIILKNLKKQIQGTVNVSTSSNVIVGSNTNFIDELSEGQTIFLSSGNTAVVQSVINANTIFISTIINITDNNLTMNVQFDETKKVVFSNSNTVIVDTNFTTSNDFVSVIVQKII
jgi:hypothetical protein